MQSKERGIHRQRKRGREKRQSLGDRRTEGPGQREGHRDGQSLVGEGHRSWREPTRGTEDDSDINEEQRALHCPQGNQLRG